MSCSLLLTGQFYPESGYEPTEDYPADMYEPVDPYTAHDDGMYVEEEEYIPPSRHVKLEDPQDESYDDIVSCGNRVISDVLTVCL